MEKVFRLGDSYVTVNNGSISSIRQKSTIICGKDDKFENALTYMFLNATNHSPDDLLTLISNLNLAEDYVTKKTLILLKQFHISHDISNAIDDAVRKNL